MRNFVIPGRPDGPDPESRNTRNSLQSMSGFRVRRFAAPRDDGRSRWSVVAAAAALSLFCFSVARAQSPVSPRVSDAPTRIVVSAKPIEYFEPRDPSRRRFGALEFRGGLELSSKYKEFGGISGLRVYPDGERFIAVTDLGRWIQGRILHQGEAPVGLADV